jgi:hypothetical protein
MVRAEKRFFRLENWAEPASFQVLSMAQEWRQGAATRSSPMLQKAAGVFRSWDLVLGLMSRQVVQNRTA